MRVPDSQQIALYRRMNRLPLAAGIKSLTKAWGVFMRITAVATAVCSCLVGLSIAADVEAAIKRNTNIPAQRLDQALQVFARTSGLAMAYRSELVRDLRTGGAIGQLTASETLTRLLSGTGLTYRYLDDKTVTIVTLSTDGAASSAEPVALPPAPSRDEKQTARRGLFERFRLAQVDEKTSASSSQSGDERARTANVVELEEITVTGTHIRNVDPTVPVISFDREEIERSGQATAQDFLRSMPQNFAGGGSEGGSETGIFGQGRERFVNSGAQSGVNLRGLNSRATLTLINGRRIAPAEQGLITADLSMIPLSAVERIEVLPDGASAIYGADAVAGVVNIILRKEFDGQESRARYGFSTQDGVEEYRLAHAGGGNWDSGSFFIAGEYYERPRLDEAERADLMSPRANGRSNLLPDAKRVNVVGHLQQELTAPLSLFADGIFSDGSTDYFEGDTFFETTDHNADSQQYSFAAGLEYDFGSWLAKLGGATSRSALKTDDLSYDLDGALVQRVYSPVREKLQSVDFLLTGKLWRAPAGDVSLAVGTSYTSSEFDQGGYVSDPFSVDILSRHADRNVASAFAELYVPIVGSLNLSLAGRYDDYSDFGDTFNPKIGLAWSPFPDLRLRANYSTSFRAPNSFERVREEGGIPVGSLIYPFVQPGGGGQVPVLVVVGSKILEPEESTNYSAGLTYEPSAMPGLSLTLNLFDIEYRDRIELPPFSVNAFNDPSLAPFLIDLQQPGAARALAEEIAARGGFLVTPFPGFTSLDDVRFGYASLTQNTAEAQLRGVDLGAEYKFDVGGSRLSMRVDATYIAHLRTRVSKTARSFDRIDILGQPVDLRANGSLTWLRGPWATTVVVNYVGEYRDETGPAPIDVGSLTTVDLSAAVDLGKAFHGTLFSGLSARLSVVDLFEADPPYVINAPSRAHFDPAYYDVRGRFVAFELVKSW